MRNYLRWSLFLAVGWWILLLPKAFNLFSVVTEPVHRLIYLPVKALGGDLSFFEDSAGMYVLLPVSLILGLLFSLPVLVPSVRKMLTCDPGSAVCLVMRYFLVLELWQYGWVKLVKMQFYLPEPNTVYTELGALSKDIAYWSVMGSSPAYVIFLGIIELLAGTLLLFGRTRFAGLLLAAGIFVNVAMVNFSFDISVKLFSLSLLGMTIALLCGYRNQWRYLFGLPVRPEITHERSYRPWKQWARAAVLALFVVETVAPSVAAGNLNDDVSERPAFHGAYRVYDHSSLARIYVHRQGYVIFEDRRGAQSDWKVLSQHGGRFVLLDERAQAPATLTIRRIGSRFTAFFSVNGHNIRLRMSELPYRNLPLIRSSFHWFSDSYH